MNRIDSIRSQAVNLTLTELRELIYKLKWLAHRKENFDAILEDEASRPHPHLEKWEDQQKANSLKTADLTEPPTRESI